jgi:hypothetical protein
MYNIIFDPYGFLQYGNAMNINLKIKNKSKDFAKIETQILESIYIRT